MLWDCIQCEFNFVKYKNMNFYTEKRLEMFQNVNRESVLLANDYVI